MAGNRNRRNRKNSKKWRRKKMDHLIRVLLAAMVVTAVFAIGTILVSHLLTSRDDTGSGAKEASVSGTQEPDAAETATAPEQTDSGNPPAPAQPGRVIFVGDSRTIDMFADSDEALEGAMQDGILVYARHGHAVDYFKGVMDALQPVAGDTVVSFMGANDNGAFEPYGALYDALLAQGVGLVVCTIGPCATEATYANQLYPAYHNARMTAFNEQLVPWANENDVPVIDTYTYILENIEIDPDGIHYLPRPTTALWQYILDSLEGMEELDEAA